MAISNLTPELSKVIFPEGRPSAKETANYDNSANFPAGSRSRAEINRANAQHSSGPRSEEGRAKIRLNAVSHGATAKQALLPYENKAEYEALGEELRQMYDPQTDQENELLHTIHETKWKLARLDRQQNNVVFYAYTQALKEIDAEYESEEGVKLDEQTRHDLAEGLACTKQARIIAQYQRHSNALQRLLTKSIDQLVARVEERTQQEQRQEEKAKSKRIQSFQSMLSQSPAGQQIARQMAGIIPGFDLSKDSKAKTEPGDEALQS